MDSCKKDTVIPPPPPVIKKVPVNFSIANLLQSNMVVQRNKPLQIWGKALLGTKIAVNVSWETATFNCTADGSGNWKVIIPATHATFSPQTITAKVAGSDPIILKNILIGDVWVCSGQSNMVMEVDSIPRSRVF